MLFTSLNGISLMPDDNNYCLFVHPHVHTPHDIFSSPQNHKQNCCFLYLV